MADCNCQYPQLDCPCCCKEKAVLQGLINRLNGFECYLRNFLVPASCQNLPWSAPLVAGTGLIAGGGDTRYRLNELIVGGDLSSLRVWPAIGCNCIFSQISQTLYKLDGDCWGFVPPTAAGAGYTDINVYLSNKYQQKTFSTATGVEVTDGISSVLTETTIDNAGSRFGLIRGAVEWIREAKRHYHSILVSLPC